MERDILMAYRIGSGQGFYGDDVTWALPMLADAVLYMEWED